MPRRSTAKSRLQVDLSEKELATLKKVQEKLGAAAYSEAFRRTLVVMGNILEREEKGLKFGFCDSDNNFSEVWFV